MHVKLFTSMCCLHWMTWRCVAHRYISSQDTSLRFLKKKKISQRKVWVFFYLSRQNLSKISDFKVQVLTYSVLFEKSRLVYIPSTGSLDRDKICFGNYLIQYQRRVESWKQLSDQLKTRHVFKTQCTSEHGHIQLYINDLHN